MQCNQLGCPAGVSLKLRMSDFHMAITQNAEHFELADQELAGSEEKGADDSLISRAKCAPIIHRPPTGSERVLIAGNETVSL